MYVLNCFFGHHADVLNLAEMQRGFMARMTKHENEKSRTSSFLRTVSLFII